MKNVEHIEEVVQTVDNVMELRDYLLTLNIDLSYQALTYHHKLGRYDVDKFGRIILNDKSVKRFMHVQGVPKSKGGKYKSVAIERYYEIKGMSTSFVIQ